jgi:hypothetical protein
MSALSRRAPRFAVFALAVGLIALAIVEKGHDSTGGRRVGSGGVTVALPRGWHDMPQMVPPSTMKVGDPVTRVVVASAPIDFNAKGCNEFAYAFSIKAVAVVILEWVRPTPGHLSPRPRHFTRKNLPVRPPPALECWDGPGGGAQFTDHGRRFAAFILLGRRASVELADRARSVLDTVAVK